MGENNYNSGDSLDSQNDFNLREELDKYFFHWRWFLLSIVLMLTAGFLYLRYAVPVYSASTTILVKDDKKGGLASEFAGLSEIGLFGNSKSNVDNEIEILKSRTLIEKTIKELRLNYTYIKQGHVKSAEIYNGAEIIIDFKSNLSEAETKKIKFRIEERATNKFELFSDNDSSIGVFSYGQNIKLPKGDLIVIKNPKIKSQDSEEKYDLICIVYPVRDLSNKYMSALSVSPVSKNTTVVDLKFLDVVPNRAEDFLNALIAIYNNEAIEDKNLVSEKTFKFIAKRLELITEELTVVEKDVESFKRSNNLTDMPAEAEIYLQNESAYEKNIIETQIQQNVVKSIIDFFKKSNNSDLIPNNLIIGEGEANRLIEQYNQLVLQRNRLAKGATDLNPALQSVNQQIASLKTNVMQSLLRLQDNLNIKRGNLNNQDALISNKKEKVPGLEREFRVIDRQQKVKEALYLYLLQKREETALSLAATENNAKVIDVARVSENPVSPKKTLILLACIVLGLLIPFGIIYLSDLLDTKIKTRLDLDKRLIIPFLGDIPKSDSHNEIISANSRTSSAEAIRIVRTNLEFILSKTKKDKGKTIFLTSTIPGEGKTFVSVNLAGTIALSGKKVILVGMDIRNPKLGEYLPINPIGVTNYLATPDSNLKDYISTVPNFKNFDVLHSGAIPPNPAELLMDEKVNKMFDELKSTYDYIVVDTAPVSVVTDTILIATNADAFIYVVRANYLDRRMLRIPEMLYNERKLPNMALVLNDTKMSNKGYGYGYGYGYGATDESSKKWWQSLLKKQSNS